MSRDAYAIRLDRRLDREAVRVVNVQIARARRGLKQGDDVGVHTARKAIKRARAALRLFRGGLDPGRFDALDRSLRRIGRATGPVRDGTVALLLTDERAKTGDLPQADRLRDYLREQHRLAWKGLAANGGPEALRDDLAALRLTHDDTSGLDPLALHDGLARTFSAGRIRLARAAQSPDAETLHTWRKRVKHLGYQLRILMPAWPLVLRPTARALDLLGESLGRDHDLAEWGRVAKAAGLSRAARQSVKKTVREEREQIQDRLWPLGARVYAEEPSPFASRLTVYLAAALAETSGAPIHSLDGLALPASPNRPFVTA